MKSYKLKARIGKDSTLEWVEASPHLPTGEVEIIVAYEPTTEPPTSMFSQEDVEYIQSSAQGTSSTKQALKDSFEQMYDNLGITVHRLELKPSSILWGNRGLKQTN